MRVIQWLSIGLLALVLAACGQAISAPAATPVKNTESATPAEATAPEEVPASNVTLFRAST